MALNKVFFALVWYKLCFCRFNLCWRHEYRFAFALKCHQLDVVNRFPAHETLWGKKQLAWRNSGCSTNTPPFWMCSNVPVQSLKDLKTIHEECVWRKLELHSLCSFFFFFFYWGSGAVERAVQRRKETKDWKHEGERGCEPTLSRAFCNQRWEYNLNKSAINLSHYPQGTPGLAVTDPPLCFVLQMGGGAVQTTAAGVHGGIHAAGLEKHIQYNKFHKHTHAQIFGGLPMVVYHMQTNTGRVKGVTSHTFSKLLPQHMHKHLYIAEFFRGFHSVWTQQSCTRGINNQEDVCLMRKTILQTHQDGSAGLDIDINIKFHQQPAIMFLFRAGKGNWNQFQVSRIEAIS